MFINIKHEGVVEFKIEKNHFFKMKFQCCTCTAFFHFFFGNKILLGKLCMYECRKLTGSPSYNLFLHKFEVKTRDRKIYSCK